MNGNLTATRSVAAKTATIMQRAWALMLAAALCLGLMPAAAWAAEGEGTFSVALTIVDTSDPSGGAVKNVKVDGMTADQTVADLLSKAGFSEATQEEAEADKTGALYFSSWGSPSFLGKGYDGGTGNYWVTMFDGASAGYESAQLTSRLSPNGHYQYIYGTADTFEYSDDVPQLVLNAINNPLPVSSTPDPKPEAPSHKPGAVDTEASHALFSAIAASYEGTSEEWKALDLAAIGKASAVDVGTLVKNAKGSLSDHGTTNLQRFILALTAVGATDEASELIEAMASSPTATSMLNGQVFALLAYESSARPVPASAVKTQQELIDAILAAQLSSGGWNWTGSNADPSDPDLTAMVVAALASHVSQDATVKASVDRALEALRGMQYEDGGFRAYGETAADPANVGSTSSVIIALCALGIDPATSWVTENGSTPLSALLSQASSDRTAFLYKGAANALATEQGFRALVAYQGLKNTGAAYNVYTQAKLGQAGLPGDAGSQGQDQGQNQDQGTAGNTPSSDKKPLAKTGDSAAATAAGAAALAACALAAGTAAARRARDRRVPSLRG